MNWDTTLEYRNAADALYQETVNYDDGQQQVTVFDVDDTETWDTYIRLYDAGGGLISETYI